MTAATTRSGPRSPAAPTGRSRWTKTGARDKTHLRDVGPHQMQRRHCTICPCRFAHPHLRPRSAMIMHCWFADASFSCPFLARSRRRALWLDFSAVVDAAQADGGLSGDAAGELRRLAYAFMGCLGDIYAAGAGGEADRSAFLARARRALVAAANAAAFLGGRGYAESFVMQTALQAAKVAAEATPQPLPPQPQPAAAAVAAA